MKPPCISVSEEAAARARYSAALAAAPAELALLGRQVLGRISPPNWTLEWSLPGWLGQSLGLSAAAAADLTAANVYGLAYVRLQDDLVDDEVAEEDRAAALLLSTVLYQRWLQVYIGLFAGDSPFWGFFEQSMARWVAATLDGRRLPAAASGVLDDAALRGLGDRGAPLKICVAGACLLVGRDALIPQLETALDHLLSGAVLLDHVQDWAADVTSGRYNAFVAHLSGLPQTPDRAEASRRAVTAELMLGTGGRPYFDVLQQQLRAAGDEARAAGIFALADYVLWLRREADRWRSALIRDARTRLHGLAAQVLGPTSGLELPVVS